MSYLTQPTEWSEGVKKLRQKTEVASVLDSEAWQSVPDGLRDRAYFSARITSARFLERAKAMTQNFLDSARETVVLEDGTETTKLKTGGRADFVKQMQDWAVEEGMGDPLPPGVGQEDRSMIQQIQDPTSNRRLGLIFETNMRSAYGYGNFQASTTEAVTDAYPAWRFVRGGFVTEPRPIHQRNEGQVRRKDDTQFWLSMNDPEHGGFGVPHGPWGFNSQMDVEEVPRSEAVAMGLLKENESIHPPQADFNELLSVDTDNITGKMAKILKKVFGNQITQKGSKLVWKKK